MLRSIAVHVNRDALEDQFLRIHRVHLYKPIRSVQAPHSFGYNWRLTGPGTKIGCFKANFSTPPLIMSHLRVMIPAFI